MNTTEQLVANVTGASTGLTVPDTFPPFSLTHLLRTVFYPKAGDKVVVSEPRIPCYKLGLKLNDRAFPAVFAKALRPGAYLRIIKEGDLGASDSIQIISRPDHGVTVSDVANAYLFDHRLFPRLLNVPQLRSEWHDRARRAAVG